MMLYLGVQEVGMSCVDVVFSMEVTTTPRVQSLEHGMERCMETRMSINCTTMYDTDNGRSTRSHNCLTAAHHILQNIYINFQKLEYLKRLRTLGQQLYDISHLSSKGLRSRSACCLI